MPILLLVAIVALAVSFWISRTWKRSILIALLSAYIYFILVVTLLNRNDAAAPKAELTPFWSWMNVIKGYRRFWNLEEIGLNVLLFIPFGVLLGTIFKAKWFQGLLIGFGCSLIIETVQYFTCRGLFEWDDMIHNAIGCVIGIGIADLIMKTTISKKMFGSGENRHLGSVRINHFGSERNNQSRPI